MPISQIKPEDPNFDIGADAQKLRAQFQSAGLMPVSANPQIAQDANNRQALSLLGEGLGRAASITPYSAKVGIQHQPGWDAARALMQAPVEREKARVSTENTARQQIGQYAAAQGAGALQLEQAGLKGQNDLLKQLIANTGQANRGVEAAKQANEASHYKTDHPAPKAGKTEKQPAMNEVNQMDILHAAADQIHKLAGINARYPSMGSLMARLGPAARGANIARKIPLVGDAIGGLIPGSSDSPDDAIARKDASDAQSAVAGMTGNSAIALEPRRMAWELQQIVNGQFPEGGDTQQSVREKIGIVAKHIARNYRDNYGRHAQFYEAQHHPTPDDFEAFLMDGLIAPSPQVAPGAAAKPDFKSFRAKKGIN